jgi:hypothetical protein
VSVGSLYREIGRQYRAHLRRLLGLAVVVFIPVGLAQAVPVEIHLPEDSALVTAAKLLWFGAEEAAILFGLVFYSGAIGNLLAEGGREPLGQLLLRLPYRRLAAVDLLTTFGTLFGLVLLIVPGVLFLAYHCLAAPLAEIEELSARAAMRRSRALVRGELGTVMGVMAPLLALLVVLSSVREASATVLLGGGIPADWLAATLFLIATSPFYALATVTLALELRRRHRGAKDVTVRAAG